MATADDVVALLKKKGSEGLSVQEMERILSMTEKQVRGEVDGVREKHRASVYNVEENKFAYLPEMGPREIKHG